MLANQKLGQVRLHEHLGASKNEVKTVYADGLYYYSYGGRWFVSRDYRGTWGVVEVGPPVLAKLPPGHFHKHLPPGLQKQGKIPPGHLR